MRFGHFAALVLLASCYSDSTFRCGERLCAAGTTCVGEPDSNAFCASPDQLAACAGAPDGVRCTASADGEGTCVWGACVPPVCGNGIVEPLEHCDDSNRAPGDRCAGDCQSPFTRMQSNTVQNLESVWAAAPDDVYATGDIWLHYDGSRWARFDGPRSKSICGTKTTAGEVVLYSVGGSGVHRYAGGTWTMLTSTQWSAITCNDASDEIVVARRDSATGQLLVGRYGASGTWSVEMAGTVSGFDENNSPRTILVIGGGDLLIAFSLGNIARSVGGAWTISELADVTAAFGRMGPVWQHSDGTLFVGLEPGGLLRCLSDTECIVDPGSDEIDPRAIEGVGDDIVAVGRNGAMKFDVATKTWGLLPYPAGVDSLFDLSILEEGGRLFAVGETGAIVY